MITKANNYDVAIIGGGPGGLFCAYRLFQNAPNLKIVLIESGKPLANRRCPMIAEHLSKCMKCPTCSIMRGMAGAGAFSDGKYILGTEYGGWLPNLVKESTVLDYIYMSNDILEKYGATKDTYYPNDALKLECLKYDLHMLQTELKHLGTDENYLTMLKMISDLENKVEIVTNTYATDVDKSNNTIYLKKDNDEQTITAENIVMAVGRAGSEMLMNWCKKNEIELENNQVDIGVRVELPRLIWKSFAEKIYEPKIVYRTKKYADNVRMFCFNDGGNVIIENTDGIYSVNGHAYKSEALKTKNSNFAILSTSIFTQPFKQPIQYAKAIASLSNMISGGSVLVQRFGDLIRGRRTDAERILASTTKPTLEAVPGDLSLCIPKRQLENIIEMIYALDKVAPGTANDDTLLYGVECKYYSARPVLNNFEIQGTHKIYGVGDGAGITRSLSQAGANGIMVADIITKNITIY